MKIPHSFPGGRHTRGMEKKFLVYGILGWCAEILWTGICSFFAGDSTLAAKTYLWMFPIYGLAAFAEPAFLALRRYCPLWQRCGVYILGIFTVEFLTGGLLRLATGVCPWDYGSGALSVLGLVRLDYAPLWAMLGLFFEETCWTMRQFWKERG